MYSENGDRARNAAVTAAGIDHVRLWYHYLDIGDLDACGSLLDENAQLSHPDAPPGHGRDQVVQRQAELAPRTSGHRIYKIVAADETVAVMGSYASSPGAASPRGRGRPRAFDRDEALTRAMHLFWRKGFAATSIAELTAAMGIGSSSLYAAFGS